VTAAVGAFSTWFSIDETDVDGFRQLVSDDGASAGAVVLALAIVLAGVAVITVIGRRVVPIAIAGVGVGVATIVVGVMRRGDLRDAADRYAGLIELGPGSGIVIAGGAVATLGALIMVLTRRRR
jgi:hypothetical protein